MIVVGEGIRLVAIVAIVAVAVVGRRVQLTVLVFFAALATDGVVATHHVVDRRVFLMAGGFASTAARGMVEVRRETVRPAVGVLGVAASGDAGIDGDGRETKVGAARAWRRGGEGLMLELSGGRFLDALLVRFGEEDLEVGPRLDSSCLAVPVADVELEETGFDENRAGGAQHGGFGDRITTGFRNGLNGGVALPEGFHLFVGFPLIVEHVLVDFQGVVVELTVGGVEVNEQLADADVGVVVATMLEGADERVVDRVEQLRLRAVSTAL